MAREIVTQMLKTFSGIWEKKITQELQKAYIQSLKPYSDDDIRQAGYKCIDNCSFFPKPAQVISYIYGDKTEKQYSAKFNMYSGYCQVCKKTDCITMKDDGDSYTGEKGDGLWKCRECYTGLTEGEIKERYDKLMKILEKMDNQVRSTKTYKNEREKREKSLGFDPKGIPVMTVREESERRQFLMDQYAQIKSGEINLQEIEELPF